ncbi:hypothetical protein I79_005957 [Cricetulus griseus]|uniref:Uncharacterized protein n=1 Tax=Cricetulus griseus TaxID=10029 RepID=G3H6J5_CRIGR|nr:hypothetical protein I79_005957 [Cricetulus griseus]
MPSGISISIWIPLSSPSSHPSCPYPRGGPYPATSSQYPFQAPVVRDDIISMDIIGPSFSKQSVTN